MDSASVTVDVIGRPSRPGPPVRGPRIANGWLPRKDSQPLKTAMTLSMQLNVFLASRPGRLSSCIVPPSPSPGLLLDLSYTFSSFS